MLAPIRLTMTPGLVPVAGGALAVMTSWVMYMATRAVRSCPRPPRRHMVAQGLGTVAVIVGITQAVGGGFDATLIALSVGSLPLVMARCSSSCSRSARRRSAGSP